MNELQKTDTPWTEEQVKFLRAHQHNPHVHPYTCGNDSRHRELVATPFGWHCRDCDYTQKWAMLPKV